mgnify:CR=1 FL=1
MRHKNVVQFIGACTKPLHLCIVTGDGEILLQTLLFICMRLLCSCDRFHDFISYFFPEFMSGGSVYDYLHNQRGVFKFPVMLRVAIDVSKGMDYLHQNNIIHRDLKAANLLMDEHEVMFPCHEAHGIRKHTMLRCEV